MSTAVAYPSLDREAVCALLARSDFFVDCQPEDIALLAEHSRFEEFAPGEDIVREGDPANDAYVIHEGCAAVLKRGTGSTDHEIARLGPGASFGEMALLDPGCRSATVRAIDRMRILVIPIDQIITLAKERPTFVRALIGFARLVATRLRTTNASAVTSLERALAEERTRVTMGKFTFLLIIAYSLYT